MPVGFDGAQPAKLMQLFRVGREAERKVGRCGCQLVGYRARLVCQSDDAYCASPENLAPPGAPAA